MTDAALVSRELEGGTPTDALRWASRELGERLTFATAFGPEGCVIIDLIAKAGLAIDVFTLDTGVLFPETYTLWRQLEAKYGLTIRGVRAAMSLDEQAVQFGPALWERDPDTCCDVRKVRPLREALEGRGGWITAIRRDQTPDRATAQIVERDEKFGLLKINPLVAWTHDDVWAHVYANDVPTNALHEQGYPSIGCAPCTSPVKLGESARAGRWRGAQKTECGLHVKTDTQEQSS
ncbi:phosphoadenylyl-sulfate reductase [soil metagenome]